MPTDTAAHKPAPVVNPSWRYDHAERRAAKRSGREKGCWTYIPGEVLASAGFDPDGPPPFYRVFARGRRSVAITFYDSK